MKLHDRFKGALAAVALAAVSLWFGSGLVTPAFAQLKGTQTEGTIAPIPIAIPLFLGDDQKLAADISNVVQADLERSGLFRPLERESFLEQKLEEERKAEEAKKAEEEAKKKKAEEEKKKKAEEAERKKKRAEELKKKKQEEAKKKAEAAKKKFDPSRIAALLEKSPDDAPPKALLDKDPRKKGQQAAGSSRTVEDTGREAGTATGTDTVLSAREQDLLKGMLKSQLNGCWRPPGTGGGSDVPVVTLHWDMNPDGSIAGEPRVISAPSTTAGQVYTEAALRAVKMCAPFRLPPDKFEGGWKSIDWTFDPREML
jgi:colicin import membrane protein